MATVFMNWMKNVSERRENRTKNGKKREKAENPKEDEKKRGWQGRPRFKYWNKTNKYSFMFLFLSLEGVKHFLIRLRIQSL